MSDLISRKALIHDLQEEHCCGCDLYKCCNEEDCYMGDIFQTIRSAPTIEAEPTFEQIEECCRKRCLVVVDGALFNEMKSRWSSEPVKHGRWLIYNILDYAKRRTGRMVAKCSVCGLLTPDWRLITEKPNWNYCPNCGAKMDDTPTEKVDISTENTNKSTDEVEE